MPPPRSHIHHVDRLSTLPDQAQAQPQPQPEPNGSNPAQPPLKCPLIQTSPETHTPTQCETCTEQLEERLDARVLRNLEKEGWTQIEIDKVTPVRQFTRQRVSEMRAQRSADVSNGHVDQDHELQMQLLEEFNFRLKTVRDLKAGGLEASEGGR